MPRRGVILVELIAACGLTVVLLALCVQVLSAAAVERRHVERRAIAMQEAANLLERTRSIAYDELTNERLAEIKASGDVTHLLPELTAVLTASNDDADLPSKQVTVELRWNGPGGQNERPVTLSYWTFETIRPEVPVEGAAEGNDSSNEADRGGAP